MLGRPPRMVALSASSRLRRMRQRHSFCAKVWPDVDRHQPVQRLRLPSTAPSTATATSHTPFSTAVHTQSPPHVLRKRRLRRRRFHKRQRRQGRHLCPPPSVEGDVVRRAVRGRVVGGGGDGVFFLFLFVVAFTVATTRVTLSYTAQDQKSSVGPRKQHRTPQGHRRPRRVDLHPHPAPLPLRQVRQEQIAEEKRRRHRRRWHRCGSAATSLLDVPSPSVPQLLLLRRLLRRWWPQPSVHNKAIAGHGDAGARSRRRRQTGDAEGAPFGAAAGAADQTSCLDGGFEAFVADQGIVAPRDGVLLSAELAAHLCLACKGRRGEERREAAVSPPRCRREGRARVKKRRRAIDRSTRLQLSTCPAGACGMCAPSSPSNEVQIL
eukprot:Rhum_TRINITY_DN14637_c2_g2::Rhum_TRINITY_DN14637_c2_g2_i1::g.102624::m.102624